MKPFRKSMIFEVLTLIAIVGILAGLLMDDSATATRVAWNAALANGKHRQFHVSRTVR